LFCAAVPKKWAKTPLEGQRTMFSGALLNVLEKGDEKSGAFLTPKQTAILVQREIRDAFGSQGVRPQIHVPIQGHSDPLMTAYFPNPSFNTEKLEERITKLEENMQETKQTMAAINLTIKQIDSRPSIAPEQLRLEVERISSGLIRPPRRHSDGLSRRWRTILGCVFIDTVTFGFVLGALYIAARLKLEAQASSFVENVFRAAGMTHVGVASFFLFVAFYKTWIDTPSGPLGPRISQMEQNFKLSVVALGLNSLLVAGIIGLMLSIPPSELTALLAPAPNVLR
jgi:hypothetical protein